MRIANPFFTRLRTLLEHQNAPRLTEGTVSLNETVLTEDVSKRIDKNAGIISDVKIRGPVSENGREYGPQCDDDGLRLYEGCEVNIEHPPKGREGGNRSIKEGWAVLRNVRKAQGGGNIGDLHYLKEHADTPLLIERYERGFPLGLSHNAQGRMGQKNGKAFVESLTTMHSVDLVKKPATTKNLHESIDGSAFGDWLESFETDDTELAAILEAMAAHPTYTQAPMGQQAAGDDSGGLKSAVLAAVAAKLPTADVATLKKVLKALGIEDSMSATVAGATDQKTTEAIDLLTEQLKADEKGAGALKVLTEAIAAGKEKPAEKLAESETVKTLTERVEKLEPVAKQLATMQHKELVRNFMEANQFTTKSLGADRVTLLESCADEPAMKKLAGTWPASCKNVRPPFGQLNTLTESKAAAPKTAGDVRSMLRS